MTLASLIQDLEGREIHLSVKGGKLALDAPKGAVTEVDIATIKARKSEILAHLSPEPATVEQPSTPPTQTAADYLHRAELGSAPDLQDPDDCEQWLVATAAHRCDPELDDYQAQLDLAWVSLLWLWCEANPLPARPGVCRACGKRTAEPLALPAGSIVCQSDSWQCLTSHGRARLHEAQTALAKTGCMAPTGFTIEGYLA